MTYSSISRLGLSLSPCVLSGPSASDRCAPGLGLLVYRVADAGAQRGQDGVAVRGAGHVCVQPAAAAGFQLRAGGGEQANGTLRVVLAGDGRQGLEVVGCACFVSGL